MNIYKMDLGERLKKARVNKEMSQSDLANAVGIHYTQIKRYENKSSQPAADVLSKIAIALEISSDFLMNGSSDDMSNAHLTDNELLNQFKQIEKLPDNDISVVKVFLDAFITKKKYKPLFN